MEAIILKFGEEGLDEVTESILRTVNRLKALQSSLESTRRAMQMVTQSKLDTKLNRIGIAANNAADRLSKLNAQMVILNSQASGNPRAIVPHVASAKAQPSRPGTPAIKGPFSRLAARQSQLQAAIASGDPTAILDAQYNMSQAQKSVQRTLPPTFASNLNRLIMSTRVGNGSAMPLVGNIARLAGARGAMAGPAGVAVGGVVIALQKMYERASAAAGRVNQGTGFAFTNPAGASGLSRFGVGLGFDPMSASNSFQSAIQSGAARSFATRAGVNPYYNEYSGSGGDFAAKMTQFLKFYGDPTKTGNLQASAAARSVGLENEIGLSRAASAPVRAKLLQRYNSFTPEDRQKAADFTITKNLAMDDFNKALDKLAIQTLPAFTGAIEGFLFIGKNWDAIMGEIKKATFAMIPFANALSGLKDIIDAIRGVNKNKKKKDEDTAQNLNKASEKLVEAAEAFKDGTYGAANVNGIVPAGVRGAVQNGDANAARYYANQGLPLI